MKASQLRNEVECHEIYKEIHIIDSRFECKLSS